MWELLHRREDGTFVIQHLGHPYHVIPGDPLFPEVAAAAEGVDLPPEPSLATEVIAPAPQLTRDELMARLLQIQAQIEALPA